MDLLQHLEDPGKLPHITGDMGVCPDRDLYPQLRAALGQLPALLDTAFPAGAEAVLFLLKI